ncbi:MAG: hypothetical protein M3N32_04745 [Actinomycetota bacterium]|nr:hypothetical protein [Actinomycetota bacterium]
MIRSKGLIIAVATVLAVVTACTREQSGGFDPETLLRIEEPQDGAQVSLPVSVRLSSNVPIGQARSVQVYVNGLEGPRVAQTTFELTDLEPGDNAIAVSLLNRDGSPAGGDDSVHITVTGGGE